MRPRRGMALIDVIVGGLILAIGIAASMSLASRSLVAQRDGERVSTAAWLADELLAMVVVEGPVAFPQLHDIAGKFDEPFDQFTYEVEIEDQGDGEPFRVAAVVKWGEGGHNIRVETLVALRLGDPLQLREPMEPVDRDLRWLEMQEEDE